MHAFTPADFSSHVVFSQLLLQSCLIDRHFPAYVLFTDEAWFTGDGMLNSQNSYTWADENPCSTVVRYHQCIFAVNLWAGIVNDGLMGPYLLPLLLTGTVYTMFLRHILPRLFEHIPLVVHQRIWFQHDGPPAHS